MNIPKIYILCINESVKKKMNYQKYNLVKVIGVLENSKTHEGIEESIFSF